MFTDIKVHFDLLKDFEARSKEIGQDGSKPFGKEYFIIFKAREKMTSSY